MMPQVDRIERSYSTSSNGSSTTRRKVKRPLYERSEFYSLKQGEVIYFHGPVERFRFKYHPGSRLLPPQVRNLDPAQMRLVAEQIRRDAADFMNRFSNI